MSNLTQDDTGTPLLELLQAIAAQSESTTCEGATTETTCLDAVAVHLPDNQTDQQLHTVSGVDIVETASGSSGSRVSLIWPMSSSTLNSLETAKRNLTEEDLIQPKRKRYDVQNQVSQYFTDNMIFTENEFMNNVRTRVASARVVWDKIKNRLNYRKIIDIACRVSRAEHTGGSFSDRINAVKHLDIASDEELMLFNSFIALFELNGFSPYLLENVFACLERVEGSKIRTVYMQGPPNAGKSAFINLIESLYLPHEIGRFGPQALNSQFWLQDLYGKQIYIGDECKATPLNIQTLLLLMEGNASLETEIKYGDKVPLDANPVVIAVNRDIWADCQGYVSMVRARCVELRFTKRCPSHLTLYSRDNMLKRRVICNLRTHYTDVANNLRRVTVTYNAEEFFPPTTTIDQDIENAETSMLYCNEQCLLTQ